MTKRTPNLLSALAESLYGGRWPKLPERFALKGQPRPLWEDPRPLHEVEAAHHRQRGAVSPLGGTAKQTAPSTKKR